VRLVEYHGVWRKLAGRRDWERKRGTVRCNMFFMVYDALPGGRLVRSDGVRIVGESIHFDAGDYDVPLAEYEDAQDILSWVMHLSDKNWCSLDEITSFIHHVTEMRGISVYR
jgi:hypothetical protein